MTLRTSLIALMALATLPFVSSCSSTMEAREVTADRVAAPVFMVKRQIPAGLFNLVAWERVRDRAAPANVYIEGDGLAWLTRSRPSLDPTPQNPVALNLAAMDKARNVIYLSRPCMYEMDQTYGGGKPKWNGEGACPIKYWTSHRFSPDVLLSMNVALDEIKARYGVTEFNLIGYSGGGNVAALLAASRDDVASLRTVAGNLDHSTFTDIHDVTPMTASLNAVDEVEALASVPQHHFIGGEDTVVPPAVFHSYDQKVSPSQCVAHTLVPGVTHESGWVEKWPELLRQPFGCDERMIEPEVDPSMFTPPPPEFLDAKK